MSSSADGGTMASAWEADARAEPVGGYGKAQAGGHQEMLGVS
jgi:hypothetical protein